MAAEIHATAVVEKGAELGEGVSIGPFALIGPDVVLEDGVRIEAHVVVTGHTRIGAGSRAHSFAVIGTPPQDTKYRGEPSELRIGRNVIIREHASLNPGTEGGGMLTSVGDNCLIMMGAHIAHDCALARNVILVNNVLLGGHVHVDEFAILGGGSAVHQFVRIGKHAMVGGMSAVENDVIPYGSVMGNRAHLSGLNIVGLKRRGFSRDSIHRLRNAYRLLFAEEGTLQERLADVAGMFADEPVVMDIVEFIRGNGSRALCQPRNGRG